MVDTFIAIAPPLPQAPLSLTFMISWVPFCEAYSILLAILWVMSPYVCGSTICEIKDTFPALPLVINSVEVKESRGIFAPLSTLLLFLFKKTSCCNTGRLA